jgi:hypothetical protein
MRLSLVVVVVLCGACGSNSDEPRRDDKPAAPAGPLGVELRTDAAGLATRTTAKGTTVTLDGRFASAVIARVNPDGTVTTECHDDESSAEAFAAHGTTARAGEVK